LACIVGAISPISSRNNVPVVLDVPLRDVGVMPLHFCVEGLRPGLEFETQGHGPDDPLEALETAACAEPFDRIRPVGSIAQGDGIVIAIREAKAEQEPSHGVRSERVDHLFPHEAQSGRAEDHHPLLVQADDPQCRLEIEDVGQALSLGGPFRRP
jgi:hypothetical protein